MINNRETIGKLQVDENETGLDTLDLGRTRIMMMMMMILMMRVVVMMVAKRSGRTWRRDECERVLEQVLGVESDRVDLETLVDVLEYQPRAVDLHGQVDRAVERNRAVSQHSPVRLRVAVHAHVLVERRVEVQLFDVLAARSLAALVQQLD